MIIKNVSINDEMIKEIGKFTILMGLLEKKFSYGREKKMAEFAIKIEQNIIFAEELAHAIRGRVDLYEEDVEIYIQYILEEPKKVDHIMSNKHRQEIIDFINSGGKKSFVGGLRAIYRVRNNLFHGIKEICELNGQIELFKAMNSFLENII